MTNNFNASHLAGAFAAGAIICFLGLGLLFSQPSAPTDLEMASLRVEPVFHDWSAVPSGMPASYWSFGPYKCEDDCSGHRAGWDWAQKERARKASQCDGSGSNSFLEGCRYYLQVRGTFSGDDIE